MGDETPRDRAPDLTAPDAVVAQPQGTELVPGHEHRIADKQDWPHLPVRRGGAVAAHPYCAECGMVKSIGADRALDHGGLMNRLARLRERLQDSGYVFTDVQKRLVVRRLEDQDAGDAFVRDRASQDVLVAEAVGRALGVPPRVIATYLEHVH